MKPLQTLVASQQGLDVGRLQAVIEAGYVAPSGKRVQTRIAQGVYIDGVPGGTLLIEEVG